MSSRGLGCDDLFRTIAVRDDKDIAADAIHCMLTLVLTPVGEEGVGDSARPGPAAAGPASRRVCGAKVPRGPGGSFAEAGAPRSVLGPAPTRRLSEHEGAACPGDHTFVSQRNTPVGVTCVVGHLRP